MHVDPVIHMSMPHPHNLENRHDNNYLNASTYITFIDSPGNMGTHRHRPTSMVTEDNLCDKKKILSYNSIYIFCIIFNTKTEKSILTYKLFNSVA